MKGRKEKLEANLLLAILELKPNSCIYYQHLSFLSEVKHNFDSANTFNVLCFLNTRNAHHKSRLCFLWRGMPQLIFIFYSEHTMPHKGSHGNDISARDCPLA
jgi:hypothetical protein